MEAATAAPPGPRLRSRRPRLVPLGRASDERLVALVRAGDDQAFATLFERHHRALLAFCRHMLGSREEAEDAVQLVFVSAHRQLHGSAEPIRLKPWLFTVARNRCLSILRARREHAEADVSERGTEGLADEVQRRADLRALVDDLGRLPDDQRAALVLAELEGFSHADIAEVLSCPSPKVRALVFQARERLLAAREARDADCREIRETLATARGGELRRRSLRTHLGLCSGCRSFRDEVSEQRAALALVLPVIPTAALTAGALGPILGGGAGAVGGAAAGAGGAATGAAGGAGSGMAAKAAVAVALAGAGAGTWAGVRALDRDDPPPRRPEAARPASAGGAAAPAPPARAARVTGAARRPSRAERPRRRRAVGRLVARPGTRPAEPADVRSSAAAPVAPPAPPAAPVAPAVPVPPPAPATPAVPETPDPPVAEPTGGTLEGEGEVVVPPDEASPPPVPEPEPAPDPEAGTPAPAPVPAPPETPPAEPGGTTTTSP